MTASNAKSISNDSSLKNNQLNIYLPTSLKKFSAFVLALLISSWSLGDALASNFYEGGAAFCPNLESSVSILLAPINDNCSSGLILNSGSLTNWDTDLASTDLVPCHANSGGTV
jgi:hypothetical protein